ARARGLGVRGASADRPGRSQRRRGAGGGSEREARPRRVSAESREAEVHPRHGDVRKGLWALAFAAAALLALAVGAGFWQTSMIFPTPARGREPAYPDNVFRTPDAVFMYFH